MTAPVEPEIREEIDLSWVTFAEEDPTEECVFVECTNNAEWMITTKPCGHDYPFCDFHTQYTRQIMAQYPAIICTKCQLVVHKLEFNPIKRG